LAAQRADVRPVLRRLIPSADVDSEDVAEDLPVIPYVKVMHLQAGDCILHMPVKKGSTGLLIFLESDPSVWFRTGDTSSPGDQRKHSLANAVFYPGLVPDSGKVSGLDGNALVLQNGGHSVKHTTSKTEIGGNTDSAALASAIDQMSQDVAQAFATFSPGDSSASFPNPYTHSGRDFASDKLNLGG
jgi:hypothetical protein